jgi:hypothetical protein
MSEKNCPVCANKFEYISGRRGYEQIYCSPKCRKKAGKQREIEKITNVYNHKPVLEPFNSVNGNLWVQTKEEYIGLPLDAMGDAEKWRLKYHRLLDQHTDYVKEVEYQNSIIAERLDRLIDKL